MADKLISADALQKVFNEVTSRLLAKPELSKDAEHIVRACLMVTQMINDAPAIEAIPVEWIEKQKSDCVIFSIRWMMFEEILETWKEGKNEVEE